MMVETRRPYEMGKVVSIILLGPYMGKMRKYEILSRNKIVATR